MSTIAVRRRFRRGVMHQQRGYERMIQRVLARSRSPAEPAVVVRIGNLWVSSGANTPSSVGRSRWHVDITPGLRDDARFDFLMVLPQEETRATFFGLLQSAIERHFAVAVKRESRMRDVYRITNTNPPGRTLWRYPDLEPGAGFSRVVFSVFMGRSTDAPMFPLEGFAVHAVLFTFLVNWFQEILGGQVIDETGLPGIYGFELKQRVNTPEALIQVLRDEAGLVITREQREIPTLIVRQRKRNMKASEAIELS